MLGVRTIRGSNARQFEHVYELRIYHVHEGKADALRDRFGNYTDALFKQHNMKSIGYWAPEDAPHSQKLFIYILEHPSREEAEKDWVAFKADPEWQKVKAQSEANGPLVDQEDSYFMDPTTYSAEECRAHLWFDANGLELRQCVRGALHRAHARDYR